MKNVLVLGNAKTQKEKLEVSSVISQLDDVYDLETNWDFEVKYG